MAATLEATGKELKLNQEQELTPHVARRLEATGKELKHLQRVIAYTAVAAEEATGKELKPSIGSQPPSAILAVEATGKELKRSSMLLAHAATFLKGSNWERIETMRYWRLRKMNFLPTSCEATGKELKHRCLVVDWQNRKFFGSNWERIETREAGAPQAAGRGESGEATGKELKPARKRFAPRVASCEATGKELKHFSAQT